MSRAEWLLWVLLVLDVLGFGGLIFWMKQRIEALEGTVGAQGKTIDAQGQSLRAAEQTFGMLHKLMETLDVEKWARRYESHSRILEAEHEAKLQAARREIERELEAAQSRGHQTMEMLRQAMEGYMQLAIAGLVHVPRAERAAMIDRTELHEAVKRRLKDFVAEVPHPLERALHILASLRDEGYPPAGGMDVRPPPLKEPDKNDPSK